MSDCCDDVVLLAVCDVLVFKALESMGKWIVRTDRARFKVLAGRSFTIAHTIWQPDDAVVSKALKGAWDVVPAMLAAHGEPQPERIAALTRALDSYVHDLAITGTRHRLEELRYRLDAATAALSALSTHAPAHSHSEVPVGA